MGWQPGQAIGRTGEGNVEPIALTVKTDRKGLSSGGEKPGKHPISMLQEICARKKWQLPDFQLIFDHGPPHSKQFLFKVAVNGYEYQPQVVSSNKKQAKAQCALYALKAIGAVPHDATF
ncbi:predicted protein [Nematostella vectensis]|uniref:Uncharacterized protein n=1 Tax=Nematostella vectensis TaxID=45351 RepID=A7SVV0_NEMVE|nr:predicted protein [Nematostella vectensis]|eukprot:XP_001624265.1 predicted protein [Nematostella vectensis]